MQKFLRSFWNINFRLKLGFASFILLLLLLPGFNFYDLLTIKPQSPKVRGTNIQLPTDSLYPVSHQIPPPLISAKAVIVIDADSGTILHQKNPDTQLLPASTTKIMTALVALEEYSLADIVTITRADDSIGHSMHLVRGETISIKNLLYGILVESGNDAAFALAQYHPQGYQGFINLMNQKAQKLHLTNTSFRNVSGVEQTNHFTSVRDLSILAREAMKNDTLAQMVATKTITVSSSDGSISHQLGNINQLLGVVDGIKGIKTGWTENAGECLVTATQRDSIGVISVVLGSSDRFGESQQLIEWAYANHTWNNLPI